MLTLKLGQAEIPMIVTNHTYDVIGAYVPTKEMGGGSGLKYSATSIIYLSKSKEKDGKEIIGNIIKCKMAKSRLSKENQWLVSVCSMMSVDLTVTMVSWNWVKLVVSGRMLPVVMTWVTVRRFTPKILAEPEKYFTEEVMEKLDVIAQGTFKYGG